MGSPGWPVNECLVAGSGQAGWIRMMKICIEGAPGEARTEHGAARRGDHPHMDYSEVLPRLQRLRGPGTLEAALAAPLGCAWFSWLGHRETPESRCVQLMFGEAGQMTISIKPPGLRTPGGSP